ncbi:hypothetical protein K3495_g13325 [Podosphaera aphanis]|nr:hypothetical protein K3495_g13325 [Podosphaera aphanis]
MRSLAALAMQAKPSSKLPPTLTLAQFMQRTSVLTLYRNIIRSTRRISDLTTRHEMIDFVRTEFLRNRNIEDTAKVRYLISRGQADLKTLENSLP